MIVFELPVTEGKPVDIVDFKLDLLLSPPAIEERLIETVDAYVSTQTQTIKIEYKDAHVDEGRLNIYVCRFKTGKYRLHIFGKIKGTEFKTEKEVNDPGSNSLGIINERMKFVLINSRNILRKYYLASNIKSMEDHLMAFLISF